MLANSAGRPALAERRLRTAVRALDRLVDTDETEMLRGRVLVTRALSAFDQGDAATAMRQLDQAEHGARGAQAGVVRTLARVQRAGLLGRLGRWGQALDALSAIDLDSPDLSPRARCVVALNTGLAHQFLGHDSDSEAGLRQALAIARAESLTDLRATALHDLGRLAMVRGRLTEALALMAQAHDLDADVTTSGFALDHARVLLEAGLLDEANDLLVEAESAAREGGLLHDVGEAALEQAHRDLLLGDYTGARAHAKAARQAFARHGAEAWHTRAALLVLEADLAAGRGLAAVATRATTLAEGPGHAAGVGIEATMLAAEALARSGQLDGARRRLVGLGGPRNLSFTNRLHLALTRATVAQAGSDLREAHRVLRRAAACLADEQARYAGLDNRTALALHGRRLAAIDMDLALRSGRAGVVFAATERWRGTSNRLSPVSPSGDAVLDDLLATLRRARLDLRDADGERRPALLREITRLERTAAHRDWETSSTDDPRQVTGRHTVRRPVTYPQIRVSLADSGTGLVALFVHGGRLRALTIDGDRSVVVDLAPEDAVIELVQRATADLVTMSRVGVPALREAIGRSLTSSMSRLDQILAAAYPRTAERLVILPSRLLASLPWRMLPGLEGHPLVVAPSATFWAGASAPRSSPGVGAVVALAGPDLARAGDEAKAVASTWGGAAVTDKEATGGALTTALRDSRIVHIAAHGTHHDQSPLFSHVLLADGPVFAHEFQRVGVGAEHVVLSACDVGRAHVRHGEEALGLTASLLACGVRNVVASVAPVHDEMAEAVMTAYHRELARGTDAATSLERAAVGIPDGRLFCAYGTDWSAPRGSLPAL